MGKQIGFSDDVSSSYQFISEVFSSFVMQSEVSDISQVYPMASHVFFQFGGIRYL